MCMEDCFPYKPLSSGMVRPHMPNRRGNDLVLGWCQKLHSQDLGVVTFPKPSAVLGFLVEKTLNFTHLY